MTNQPQRINFKRSASLGIVSLATVLTFGLASSFAAGEPGTGGTGGGGGGATAVCDPISSLKTKADPRVGELGFASIAVDYSTKACDKDPVTVDITVTEFSTGAVIYQDANASATGKFTLNGVKLRTTYVVTVTVTNTVTGAVEGSKKSFTAAIPKGV